MGEGELIMVEEKGKHPLHQIAESPSHRLLLKQWLKEEELILYRISQKEARMDSVRGEITHLYIIFFLFHSFSMLLLLLANSSSHSLSCKRSWVPSLCFIVFSGGILWAIRYKMDVETSLEKLLVREKEDAQLLRKCADELKRKGLEFDLLKEVDALRRAKSLKMELKAVARWSARDLVSFFFLVTACFVLILTRIILCS